MTTLNGIEPNTPLSVTIGGFRNPRTFKPTGDFSLALTDAGGAAISTLSLGSVQMTNATVSSMSITRDVEKNYANSNYDFTITLSSPDGYFSSPPGLIPMKSGDKLFLEFPEVLKLPDEAIECTFLDCLDQASCRRASNDEDGPLEAEERVLVVDLGTIDLQSSCEEISFRVGGVRNAPSLVPSEPLVAY